MTALVEFLTARLDEREAQARAAQGTHWTAYWEEVRTEVGDDPHYYKVAGGFSPRRHWDSPQEPHEKTQPSFVFIAANDPAFVLADIAAKRRIIDYIAGVQRYAGEPPNFDRQDAQALTHVLRILAEPFSSHPDYQRGWAL